MQAREKQPILKKEHRDLIIGNVGEAPQYETIARQNPTEASNNWIKAAETHLNAIRLQYGISIAEISVGVTGLLVSYDYAPYLIGYALLAIDGFRRKSHINVKSDSFFEKTSQKLEVRPKQPGP